MRWLNNLFRKEIEESEQAKKDLGITIQDRRDALVRLAGREGKSYYYDLSFFFSSERKYQNLTVDELAQKSDTDRTQIIDLELGYLPLNEAVVVTEKLQEILKVDPYVYKKYLILSIKKK